MKTPKILLLLLSALLLFMTVPSEAFAEEEKEEEDKTYAPYFYVETTDTSAENFPLKKTNVTADINGIIADTRVVQTYANEGSTPVNASYIFPASTKVTVHGMQMQIGDQIVTAKIKEKEEAKQEFEEAKSEGKSASLLSEQRSNVFSMNVANIMPGDEVKIELHYTEMITPADGTYQFVFPTVVGPRYISPVTDDCGSREEWTAAPYLPEGSTPVGEYDIHVSLSAAIPIASLTSSSHDINIAWKEKTSAQISLSDPSDYAGNRDFILDYKLAGEEISSGLILNTRGNENFFMLMVQPPERCETAEILPREYIFVLDVSGSMSGYPLDTAKELIKNLVSDLKETDTFNLILFSGASYQMASRSVHATSENISRAIGLIDRQEGTGGTELAPALEDALAIPVTGKNISRSIVIITDGYIYGEHNIFEIINKNLNTANFFSFGIGSSVNRYLIEGIAQTGQGEPFIVTEAEQAAKTAQQFRTYIESPILTDIQVKFDGFDAYDVEPAVLPTLFAQKPIVLLGKWRGEPEGTIRITGKSGNGSYTQDIPVTQTSGAVSADSEALSYLWARKRVERLTDYGLTKDNPDVKDAVTQIGLNYSMLTPYTSFVAVLDTVRNPEQNSKDVKQPLSLPYGASDFSIGAYTIGSEPGESLLLAAVLLMLLVHIPLCRKRKTLYSKGHDSL